MIEITARLTTALADHYRIERHLGEGGMANVYLAQDVKHDREVAVKVLRPELAAVLGAEPIHTRDHDHRQSSASSHPPPPRLGRSRLFPLSQ